MHRLISIIVSKLNLGVIMKHAPVLVIMYKFKISKLETDRLIFLMQHRFCFFWAHAEMLTAFNCILTCGRIKKKISIEILAF